MNDIPLIAAIVVGLLTFAVLYRPFFGEKKDFWECVGYCLVPNFLSWLAKDLQRDYGKSMKLGIFFAICIGAGFLAHEAVASLLKM